MDLELILKLVSHAAAVVEAARRGLDAVRAVAAQQGATEAQVTQAIAEGQIAAAQLADKAQAVRDRIDAEGKG